MFKSKRVNIDQKETSMSLYDTYCSKVNYLVFGNLKINSYCIDIFEARCILLLLDDANDFRFFSIMLHLNHIFSWVSSSKKIICVVIGMRKCDFSNISRGDFILISFTKKFFSCLCIFPDVLPSSPKKHLKSIFPLISL